MTFVTVSAKTVLNGTFIITRKIDLYKGVDGWEGGGWEAKGGLTLPLRDTQQ